jgi:hypothetical protein
MARSIDEIKDAIKVNIRTYPSLNNFLFPEDVGGSQASVFNILIFVMAASQYVFEVIADSLKSDIQTIADTAPSGNAGWVRQKMLDFQYGDSITINTTDDTADDYFVPKYAVPDTSKQIVTQCAVSDGVGSTIDIKVAKGVSPSLTPLSAAELSALSDYYFGTGGTQGIGFAGVDASFISLLPDRMRFEADIYFYGQYVSATVKTNVITAIDAFLASFSDDNFGGNVFVIKLVDAIQVVEGVSRVDITDIKGRAESVPLGSATTVDIQGVYSTTAGYIISEDTVGNTLTNTLTMVEETL